MRVDPDIHPDWRPIVESTLGALLDAYPRVELDEVRLFRADGDESLGKASGNAILLNEYWFAHPRERLAGAAARGRASTPIGMPLWHGGMSDAVAEHLLTHEFGHLVLASRQGFEEFCEAGFADALDDPAIAVSGYALVDHEEWGAETFAGMRMGAPSPQIAMMEEFLSEDDSRLDAALTLLDVIRGDAEWSESDHPRDKIGQFAKVEGGGDLPAKPASPSTMLKKHYDKLEKFAQSGAWSEVESYPIPSSGWFKPLGKYKAALLAHHEKPEAASATAPKKPAATYKKNLEALGFEFVGSSSSGAELYKVEKASIIVDPPNEDGNSPWKLNLGYGVVEGVGYWELKPELSLYKLGKATSSPHQEKSEAAPSGPSPTNIAVEVKPYKEKLEAAGYKLVPNQGPIDVYEKGSASLSVVPEDESWISKVPGKPQVSGEGFDNLEKFLDLAKEGKPVWNVDFGKKAVASPSPTPPVASGPKPLSQYAAGSPKPPKEIENLVSIKQYRDAYQALESHAPKISSTQRDALGSYKGSGYGTMNDCMRHKDDCADHRVKVLEGWLTEAKTPTSLTLWRRVKGPFAQTMYSIGTVGMRWRERGFVSTSLDPGPMKGWGDMTMEIVAPAGMPGTTVSNEHESEVLFNRGIHLKIVEFDREKKYMKCEMDSGDN